MIRLFCVALVVAMFAGCANQPVFCPEVTVKFCPVR